jgi:elongation factor P--beta-lysine ligase
MDFRPFFIHERTIQLIRNYFIDRQFHEINTPTLLTSLPVEPNIYSLKTTWLEKNINFYLATSPESSLKKIISQGVGNCFTIAKVFRDLEDIGPTHNLEFSMLEWYEMDKNYRDIAKTTENLITNICHGIGDNNVNCTNNILTYQGVKIDLTPPWHYTTLNELFMKFAALDLSKNLTTEDIINTAKSKGYNTAGVNNWEPLYTQIFINEIEPNLPKDKPVFIFDYPTQLSPLTKPCKDSPGFSERFELYIGGMEIANAYTELTDSRILAKNFQNEAKFRKTSNLPSHPVDKNLIKSLKNLPECSGIGLGVDRLAMLFADTNKIENVLYFATSRQI